MTPVFGLPGGHAHRNPTRVFVDVRDPDIAEREQQNAEDAWQHALELHDRATERAA